MLPLLDLDVIFFGLLEPIGQLKFIGQSLQCVDPGTSLKVLYLQYLHLTIDDTPDISEYVPFGHGLQSPFE